MTTLLAGLVLMAMSFAWPGLVHEQLLKKNTAELVRAHRAMGVQHSSTATEDAREQARLERHQAQGVVNARVRQRDVTVVVLRIAGVVFTVVGVAAYFRMQSRLAD